MKLKGILKSFFILSLILLPIGFSSAGYIRDIGVLGYSPYDNSYDISVLSKGTLNTQHLGRGKNVLYFQGGDTPSLFYWDNNGLPYMLLTHSNGQTTQGHPLNYYVCDEIFNENGAGNCQMSSLNTDSVNTFISFFSTITNNDVWWFDVSSRQSYNRYNKSMSICFSSSQMHKSICFNGCIGYGDGYSCDSHNSLDNLNFLPSKVSFDSSTLSNYLGRSPGLSSLSPDNGVNNNITDEVYYSDNSQVYFDFYQFIGYNPNLCYGDFKLTEIVILTQNYYQFFPDEVGTGATVFDLHSNWFSSLGYEGWYDNMNGYYKAVNARSDYSLYMGKSRGFYRLFYKLDHNTFFDSYEPNGIDLFNYCSMVLNGFSGNSLFTGNLSTSARNIFIGSNYRNYSGPGSSSGANYYYGSSFDGVVILSGANSNFSGEVDLFGLFNRLYTNFKNAFSINPGSSIGILPTYIVMGFFLFLLFYVLRR